MDAAPDFDRQLEQVIHGRIAGRTLEDLTPILDQMERHVDQRVMGLLRQGACLSGEIAQHAWLEKYAIYQLRERLTQLANAGKGAGRQLSPRMKMEPPHA